MTSTAPTGMALNIAPLADGLYWGVLVSILLFGMTVVQGWIYINNNHDSWFLRSLVAFLIVLDLVITGLVCQTLRYYLLINFGNLDVFLTYTKTMDATVILTAIAAYLPELFFASRLYLLDKQNLWPPAIVAACTTGTFICLSLQADFSLHVPQVSNQSFPQSRIRVVIGLGLATIADLVTTAVLFRKMNNASSKFQSTQTLLQRLLVWIVTRGLLVTINQISFLVAYVTQVATMKWQPFLLFYPKLHIIMMLSMLNARSPPSTTVQSHNQLDLTMSQMSFAAHVRAIDKPPEAVTSMTTTTSSHDRLKSRLIPLVGLPDSSMGTLYDEPLSIQSESGDRTMPPGGAYDSNV